MDKELKNYLRKALKNRKVLFEEFSEKVAEATDLNGVSIFETDKKTSFTLVLKNGSKKDIKNTNAEEVIKKYEQVEEELILLKNLEDVLINNSTDKILDWRFLIFSLINIKDNIVLSSNLINLIIQIIKKDNNYYFLYNDFFHKKERRLRTLIVNNKIVSLEEFSQMLGDMLFDYFNKFFLLYPIEEIELLEATSVIYMILQNIEANKVSEILDNKLRIVDSDKEKIISNNRNFDIKRLIDEEFKKYSYLFTNINNVEYFIEYLKQLTSDELLISTYREKALKKYHSFIEEQKEYTLQDIYKEDYQVIKDSKSLNIPEINSLIDDIYIMADMYLNSNKEDKLYLLEEFKRYMINLKELFNKYSKKEEKRVSNVIYYTYKNEVVVYEQLKVLRKDSYFDYYNNINKLISNKIRGRELLGTNYGEPVYYIGKDNRVFYTFVYDIPVIINIGEFNDAIKIVNSREFKEFINNVKNNIELYLESDEDNSIIMNLLNSSKKVARKLSNE